MKTRRHHNNKAYRSTIRGMRKDEAERIAGRLKIPYSQPSLEEFINQNQNRRKAKEEIMKIEDQVCTLEQGKRLQELGVTKIAMFYHYWNGRTDCPEELKEYSIGYSKPRAATANYYPAYTVAELGEMLPKKVIYNCEEESAMYVQKDIKLAAYLNWNGFCNQIQYIKGGGGVLTVAGYENQTEAQARAEMLIYLLENKLA